MKKRALSIILSLAMLLSLCAMFAGCQDDGPVNSGDAVNITFWHPITGPDSKYMQDLIRDFNKEYLVCAFCLHEGARQTGCRRCAAAEGK